MRKVLTIIAVFAVVAITAGAAGAAINHVLGKGGKVYTFDAQCHRVSFVPPGVTTKEGLNVIAQQTRCLVRRPDPFARCVRGLGPAPKVQLVAKDDWTHVDKVAAYQAAIYACASASY